MKYKNCQGRGRKRTCKDISQKWSYAIPLEIVYSTPLQKWNPYNIKYKGLTHTHIYIYMYKMSVII